MINRPASGALIAHLRSVTRPAHDRLEGGLGLLDAFDVDAYAAVLSRFYGFWKGWEPQVAGLLGDDAFTKPRRRLHLIEADLTVLGLSREVLAALPLCPLTPLRDAAEALGSLYVMEGSTLGGRIIQRNVERCLKDAGRASSSYFNGYGARTGAMWRTFMSRLDDVAEAEMESVGRGATATFERLGMWLVGRQPAMPLSALPFL
jgi:heme oxygenase (biliverdin-IX-beta and delta-forming)